MNISSTQDALLSGTAEVAGPPKRSFARGFAIGALISSVLWGLIIWGVMSLF
ncbi:hypothetical protein ACFQI3_03915 [Hansschlegelia quercus]|uniref:hypothetical protein n=1 Tax=Hansschlegelia quercus TaxID=2528245 RepID=UPI0013EF2C73|nr:hypothetical protein [Hansschlegelia quercus]